MARISLLCRTFIDLEQFLALIPMHQLSIEVDYKLNKSKLTLVQKQSDCVLSCKKLQGFVLIYPLGWLCVGTKTIYHPEFSKILCTIGVSNLIVANFNRESCYWFWVGFN